MTKIDSVGDPRVIRFGTILRTTGLDELPQIINILKGDMSVVGPRPCLPYEYDNYLPWHKHRFQGLPGLTGLWQVTGKNRTTFDEMVTLDVKYLRRASLWLDLTIILKTLPAILLQILESKAERDQPRRK
jgi:lipopolysaccharide/colanic/teichoic acid biosynthesis glycosyltransferase